MRDPEFIKVSLRGVTALHFIIFYNAYCVPYICVAQIRFFSSVSSALCSGLHSGSLQLYEFLSFFFLEQEAVDTNWNVGGFI